jgi:hypothetical protein
LQPAALNEQAVLSAWLRVRALSSSSTQVDLDELRSLELALRPVAGVSEIQQALVPLLDRSGLHGLAMAWDGEPQTVSDEWLRARFERWLALRASEFAFLTLAQIQGRNSARPTDRTRASELLETERLLRGPTFADNLAALAEVDLGLRKRIVSSPRLSVALRPLGTGLAEYASGGGPPLQLWAATPEEAVAEANRLCGRCAGRDAWFMAGAGDGTLPAAAAAQVADLGGPRTGCIHIIEAHLVRMRALLEIVDLSEGIRARRIRLHAGAGAIESLARELAHLPPLEEDAVLGGDALSLSILESAASRVASR